MIGLDTNVLVRFLTMDNPEQGRLARSLMKSLSTTEPGWVGIATILELVWVMKSALRLDRASIAKALDSVLLQSSIVIEQSDTVETALRRYRNGKAEFSDCLIASCAQAAGCSRSVTFDRIAARDAGMELLA